MKEQEFLISEEYCQIDERGEDEVRCICGESGLFEPYTFDLKRLFKDMMKEYGRCVSSVYIGDDKPKRIGWVFEKRADKTTRLETWVTFHEKKPVTHTEYFYKSL
jgi:hypothetical protein